MVSTLNNGSYTSHGIELIAHHATAPPNGLLNIKGDTLVELYDDAYYFWHPATETFLAHSPEYHIIGSATAAQHWDVRLNNPCGGAPIHYTFWSKELQGKRKKVLDDAGDRITTYPRHEGDNQKWVLKSDGDKDG